MKNRIAVLCFILLLAMNTQVVYAGNLNSYESEVITAAQGQFEADGVQYCVDPAYINELTNYLMQDDVDITAEQKDQAISMMFSNVKEGVANGYLIPAKVTDQQEGKSTEDSNSAEDSNVAEPEDILDNIVKDSNVDSKTAEIGDSAEDSTKSSAVITKIDKENGKVVVTDQNSNKVLTVDTVIKNTGFNLNKTVIVTFGIVIILSICASITIKLNYFKDREE